MSVADVQHRVHDHDPLQPQDGLARSSSPLNFPSTDCSVLPAGAAAALLLASRLRVHHDPLQPQDGLARSSSPLNCSVLPSAAAALLLASRLREVRAVSISPGCQYLQARLLISNNCGRRRTRIWICIGPGLVRSSTIPLREEGARRDLRMFMMALDTTKGGA
jgi:hypothetical protein